MARSVAIIGAGPAGLAALKAAREEGLDAVAFEPRPTAAGLWCDAHGLVWPSLRANLSKFSCAFSDFPHADATSMFPSASEIASYLAAYAKAFALVPHIRHGATVRVAERSVSGWRVRASMPDGASDEREFDALIVASGFFSRAIIPPSILTSDRVIHAASYRGPNPFRGLRVLVVGAAFSGCDIAAEISTEAKDTAILVRRPSWYLPRWLPLNNGSHIPLDLQFYSREAAAQSERADTSQADHRRHAYFTSIVGDQAELHSRLAIPDDGRSVPVVITDAFPTAVRSGRLRVLDPSEIDLADACSNAGSRGDFDCVVLATGHAPRLDFLGRDIRSELSFDPDDPLQPLLLAKTVFPHRTQDLAFVGIYRGPYFGTIELQARWACSVISGRVSPMSATERDTAVAREQEIRMQLPRPQFPHSDYVDMCDDLAERAGVLPDLDPAGPLYQALHQGPLLPAHFRLVGFSSKPDVAHAEIDRVACFIGNLAA